MIDTVQAVIYLIHAVHLAIAADPSPDQYDMEIPGIVNILPSGTVVGNVPSDSSPGWPCAPDQPAAILAAGVPAGICMRYPARPP